jgi:hypothetical protein
MRNAQKKRIRYTQSLLRCEIRTLNNDHNRREGENPIREKNEKVEKREILSEEFSPVAAGKLHN